MAIKLLRTPSEQNFSLLLAWIAFITLLRVCFITFNGRELFVDEAQYWAWSRELAWGYHSKPPLIAWFIALSTHYLGQNEFAIRFFSPLCYALSSYFIALTAKQLYDSRTAFWAGLSWLILPSVSFSASIMSTDPFLLAAESLMLYAFVTCLKKPALYNWALFGIFLGLSYLSKYTGLFFILCIFLYLTSSRSQRHLLQTKGPYLALLISLAILWPNISWNINHHFLAFKHVSQHNIALDQASIHPLNLLNFWLAQIAMLGPFFCVALILSLKKIQNWQLSESNKLLLCFILPVFIAVSLEEFLVHGYDNWASVIYPPLIIALSHFLLSTQRLAFLKWNLRFSVAILIIFYLFELILHFADWQLPARINPYKRQSGWHQTQTEMLALKKDYEGYNYLLDGRVLFFKALFYLQIESAKAYLWAPNTATENEYNLSNHLSDAQGENFIFITQTPHNDSLYRHFRSMKVVKTIELPISSDKSETLYWIVLEGYQPDR